MKHPTASCDLLERYVFNYFGGIRFRSIDIRKALRHLGKITGYSDALNISTAQKACPFEDWR